MLHPARPPAHLPEQDTGAVEVWARPGRRAVFSDLSCNHFNYSPKFELS